MVGVSSGTDVPELIPTSCEVSKPVGVSSGTDVRFPTGGRELRYRCEVPNWWA